MRFLEKWLLTHLTEIIASAAAIAIILIFFSLAIDLGNIK